MEYLNNSKIQYLISEIATDDLVQYRAVMKNIPFFITAWQDTHESNKLTFNGVIDRKGRLKTDYFKLLKENTQIDKKIDPPKVRILKPAVLLYDNSLQSYYAMCFDSLKGWNPGGERTDLNFEWSLVRCDEYGNYLAIKDIGTGDKVTFRIPLDYERYRLLLTTKKGEFIIQNITRLNTPLLQK
jgi:hypothetical protein